MDPVDFKKDVLEIILQECPAAFEEVLGDDDTETENPNKSNDKTSETNDEVDAAEKEGHDDTQEAKADDKDAESMEKEKDRKMTEVNKDGDAPVNENKGQENAASGPLSEEEEIAQLQFEIGEM